MPTGFTAPVLEGISFEDFIWRCARGMGALVTLRDEPLDAPVPERLEPSSWNASELKKAEARLAELETMTLAQARTAAAADYREAAGRVREANARTRLHAKRLRSMLAQVQAWEPPTADHRGMKDFMLQQLGETLRFDGEPMPSPMRLPPREWLTAHLEKARRDVEYHRQHHAEEVERTEQRNRWLADLRASVPQPKPSRRKGASR